jgi:hypothetical protein
MELRKQSFHRLKDSLLTVSEMEQAGIAFGSTSGDVRTTYELRWDDSHDHCLVYKKIINEFLSSPNIDIQTIGYLLVSVPDRRGVHLLRVLNHLSTKTIFPMLSE